MKISIQGIRDSQKQGEKCLDQPLASSNYCLFCIAGSSTSEAIAFIKDQFVKRQPKDKTVYTHASCAIDTDLMRCIIRDVMNIIVEINLRKANMPL